MLAKLRRTFDLNLYEVKIWASLLSRGISTAGELSNMANVPRSRTYDVLESLERKGFVIMKLGKPIQYIAVAPKDVVDRAKKNVRVSADDKVKRLEVMKTGEMIKALENLYKKGISFIEPSELSGALKGRANIYSHIESLIKNAKSNVLLVTSEDGFIRKADAFKSTLEQAKKRGVSIRIAAPASEKHEESMKKVKGVAEFRTIKDLDARFAVIDGKQTVMMILNDKELHPNYDIGIWLSSQPLATALTTMFDNIWDKK
ncbi:MAG: helix-turn-helix domain-containing protein [Candidatus Nanoarchaeia archaeon]|nr:helix-turn-helix domain-containing protein [Candidatus Nanoarchaeia archaeon]